MKKTMLFASLAMVASALPSTAIAESSGPTCSDLEFLDIEVHGQHIIRDYLAGAGGADWPPSGEDLGQALRENGGPVLPGGPGAHGHLPAGFPPGASFCTDAPGQSGD